MKIDAPKLYLPKTGQTVTSPTANYAEGDDGWFQAGNPRTTRFVDNLNGTVSDRATGLTWVKQPELIIPGAVGIDDTNQIQRARATWKVPPDDGLGDYVAGDLVVGDGAPDALFYVCILGHTAHADKEPPNATYWRETVWTASAADLTTPATMTWANACANCLALEYASFTDWRLPNFIEIMSLYDVAQATTPCIFEKTIFINTANSGYWSATTVAGTTTSAHRCVFSSTTYPSYAEAKANARNVRPVRGGRLNANG